MAAPKRTVLFLCSGNYYRSRFAEVVFNVRVAAMGLPWQADSRGLATNIGNIGPISIHALRGLEARGITLPEPVRFPLQVREDELAAADLIIALKEAEHRKLMQVRHPAWVDRTEYWHVHDLDQATADVALPEIEQLIDALITRLASTRPDV
jgi:protein-tyrosine phosphatase